LSSAILPCSRSCLSLLHPAERTSAWKAGTSPMVESSDSARATRLSRLKFFNPASATLRCASNPTGQATPRQGRHRLGTVVLRGQPSDSYAFPFRSTVHTLPPAPWMKAVTIELTLRPAMAASRFNLWISVHCSNYDDPEPDNMSVMIEAATFSGCGLY
jgi:hypothetical protein